MVIKRLKPLVSNPISEPFSSIEDATSRLLPFHCFSYPEISKRDDQLSEDVVLEPLCERILHRKRNLEEQFRERFLKDTQDMSFCEDFLMNRLFTESEEAEMKEEREKAKFRKVQAKIVSHSKTFFKVFHQNLPNLGLYSSSDTKTGAKLTVFLANKQSYQCSAIKRASCNAHDHNSIIREWDADPTRESEKREQSGPRASTADPPEHERPIQHKTRSERPHATNSQ